MPSEILRKEIYKSYGREFQDSGDSFCFSSAERWGKAYRWYLRGWLPTRKDAAIVELGCGSGKLLYFFKQLGYKNLKGVDISPDQVALAKQVLPEVEQANVLDWLNGRQEQFDLIIALDLIEHFKRDEALRFLDLCFEALKNGGRLILQTPNADSPFGLQIIHGDITHEWAYNVNQLTRLLRRAGFLEVEAREQGPVPRGYSLKSTFRYFAWRFMRSLLKIWNIIETGGSGSDVFTRVFLISGFKK